MLAALSLTLGHKAHHGQIEQRYHCRARRCNTSLLAFQSQQAPTITTYHRNHNRKVSSSTSAGLISFPPSSTSSNLIPSITMAPTPPTHSLFPRAQSSGFTKTVLFGLLFMTILTILVIAISCFIRHCKHRKGVNHARAKARVGAPKLYKTTNRKQIKQSIPLGRAHRTIPRVTVPPKSYGGKHAMCGRPGYQPALRRGGGFR